jgi:hypothetical protein
MRGLIAAVSVWAGNVAAHTGHGAPESHVHGWGAEHALLLVVVLALLAYAIRK